MADEKIQEEKKKKYQKYLTDAQDMLVLFSGDGRLSYVLSPDTEEFDIRPAARKVIVPLPFFQSAPFSENRFLFHLYDVLALYPDYAKEPEAYGEHRGDRFLREADGMAAYYLDRVLKEGIADDPAFTEENIRLYVQNEILNFLEDCDRYAALLQVFLKAPVYERPEVKADIAKMLLLEDAFPPEDDPTGTRRDLAPLLLTREFYGASEIENPDIRDFFASPFLGMERFDFYRRELTQALLRGEGVSSRDALTGAVLLPGFVKLWKKDIDATAFSRTVQMDEEKERERKKAKRGALSKKAAKRMMQELSEQKRERAAAAEELFDGVRDFSVFGVTAADEKLFSHYEALVRKEREKMRAFWKKLIGDTSREVSVRIENVPKGKLSVPSLIRSYPDFVEAERRQNYKNIAIFDTFTLQKMTQDLPRFLDISFVIDSSGSMRGDKLGPARQALAIVLLSLDDFAAYLRENAQVTHEKCEVRTEVWLFGTDSKKILSFSDTGDKKKANEILSLARLDGTRGSTDDGACLQKIADAMEPQQIREQKAGKRIRMVFEVTDGASSFPAVARKAVEKLESEGALVQAIEIGSANDTAARASFDYVFGKNGLFLGNDTSGLPDALMRKVAENVEGALIRVFRKNG